jgi:hypothetical protein
MTAIEIYSRSVLKSTFDSYQSTNDESSVPVVLKIEQNMLILTQSCVQIG